jgi:hypothetical protein
LSLGKLVHAESSRRLGDGHDSARGRVAQSTVEQIREAVRLDVRSSGTVRLRQAASRAVQAELTLQPAIAAQHHILARYAVELGSTDARVDDARIVDLARRQRDEWGVCGHNVSPQ